jgi:cytochrome c553
MTRFRTQILFHSLIALLAFSALTASQAVRVHAEESMAEFTEDGALMLPRDYRTWVFVGGAITPDEMNDGSAAFPEFHNVYMDPRSFDHYKKTGEFPEGAVLVKETVGIGGKQAESGNGYFMGEFVGLFAEVKDSKRFPDEPDNWAFFTFKTKPGEPLAPKAAAHETSACSACHGAGAQERVFTQYYPVLQAARPQ